MTCEDVELELSGPEPSAEAQAHAASCARCQATLEALALAKLPALTAAEQALLEGLPATVDAAARAQDRAGSPARQAASLLLAAGVGALVASATLLSTRAPAEPRVELVHITAPELSTFAIDDVSDLEEADEDSSADEANLSDDEVFFEVGWPSPTEGDL